MKSSIFTRKIIAITGMLVFLTGLTYSQEKPDTLKHLNLDEVIITGSKTLVSRNNIPLTVSVVNNEAIENSSESALLPVLSENVPGLFVTERGVTGFGVANGAAGQISMRGIGGNPNTQVLILLNGNPQFMGIMGHPLADAYIASDVEKVEVIRGPASALYGTNAMGGVVNIITREQKEDGIKLNARAMYGSYNTLKYAVNGGYRKNKWNVFASFNHDNTDGHRDTSDFKINNGYMRMGYVITQNLQLSADFSLAHFIATDPGPEFGKAGYQIDITRGMGAVAFHNTFGKTNGSVRFFYNFGEHNITDGFHSKDNNYGIVAYQSHSLFKGNTITLGVDYKNYGGIAENLLARNGEGMVFGDTTVWEFAGYAYFQEEVTSKFIINAGFRLEHNNVYGNEPVPTLGFAYHITKSATFKASVAKGFRSPTIRELYLWNPANQDLKPERMVNYEAGILLKTPGDKLSAELVIFRAEGENLIKTVNYKNINTGTFTNTGVEFATTFKPQSSLTLSTNYSFISMAEPVIATPKHQFFISCTKKTGKFALNLSLQHINELYLQVAPEKLKDSYSLFNTKVSYSINKVATIFVKGENLFDQKYYINYAYPMPGILIFSGIKLSL